MFKCKPPIILNFLVVLAMRRSAFELTLALPSVRVCCVDSDADFSDDCSTGTYATSGWEDSSSVFSFVADRDIHSRNIPF